MVSVGSIIVTSHGLARVVAVQPTHAKSETLAEKNVEAVPLTRAAGSSQTSHDTEPSDTPAGAFTQSYLLSQEPVSDTDPLTRARTQAKISQQAYDETRHRLESLQDDERPQAVNLST